MLSVFLQRIPNGSLNVWRKFVQSLDFSGISINHNNLLFLLAGLLGAWTHGFQPSQNVVTHMYNAQRTGWDQNEIILNTKNVASAKFGVLATNTSLDGRIDTQPLIVQNILIGAAVHDVVYVATNNDTVYALDATTAAVITSVSLGTPVNNAQVAGRGCANDNSVVGVLSTPVIDLSTNTLYVMAYVQISSTPTYQLHALNITTLADKVTPKTVSASITLSDNSTVYNFSATYSRQRSALLLANGNVYAAFASFCDLNPSRGWVLAWQTNTLTPVTPYQIQLTNSLVTDPIGNSFFLTGIWMSGAGLAADTAGNIYGVTGNSDSAGSPGTGTTSFSPPNNIQESMIKLDSGITTLIDYFSDPNLISSDVGDNDFGSGGILLLPDQAGAVTHLALAGGKPGIYYLVNRDNMGHWSNGGTPNVVTSISAAKCRCSPTYFMGSDGVPRIVLGSSANTALIIPFLTASDTFGTPVSTAAMTHSAQGRGYFGIVSSNGTQVGSQVLWVIDELSATNPPTLYVFDAISGATLYTSVAGQWTNTGGNENTVATVSNGKVYVATDQQLYIFGLSP